MADDRSKRGPQDASRINVNEAYEVEYWSNHFSVTAQQLKDCVKKVGVMATDVKKCLGK